MGAPLMRRSITLVLIAVCISVAGFGWSSPALAGVHAVQGRGHKKHGKGTKNHQKSSPKPKKAGKKSERGFEL